MIQRKPGALRNGPFAEMPDAFRQLQGHLLKRPGGDREMVEILALDAGVPTKTHIINLQHRLIDGKAGISKNIPINIHTGNSTHKQVHKYPYGTKRSRAWLRTVGL